MSKKWFENFVNSFECGEYHGVNIWLKPYQYKNLMRTAEDNKWNMLTQKQVDVFTRNIETHWTPSGYFGEKKIGSKKIAIRISDVTGFVSIRISQLEIC